MPPPPPPNLYCFSIISWENTASCLWRYRSPNGLYTIHRLFWWEYTLIRIDNIFQSVHKSKRESYNCCSLLQDEILNQSPATVSCCTASWKFVILLQLNSCFESSPANFDTLEKPVPSRRLIFPVSQNCQQKRLGALWNVLSAANFWYR